MNDNDASMSACEAAFAVWREDPAISHLLGRLMESNRDVRALEALVQSAFEAGWMGGFNRAME